MNKSKLLNTNIKLQIKTNKSSLIETQIYKNKILDSIKKIIDSDVNIKKLGMRNQK